GQSNQSLCCNAAGLLGRSRKPLFAQEIDGLLHIARGFVQRAFAVHHPGAGALAKLLNHLRGDIRHIHRPFCRESPPIPLPGPSRIEQEEGTSCPASAGHPRLFPPAAKTWIAGPGPAVDGVDERYSALNSFACAIQPSTRPGSPTSSPILCAACGLSPASCQ